MFENLERIPRYLIVRMNIFRFIHNHLESLFELGKIGIFYPEEAMLDHDRGNVLIECLLLSLMSLVLILLVFKNCLHEQLLILIELLRLCLPSLQVGILG